MTFCLDTIIIRPQNGIKIENAVILFHGYGGDGKDISAICHNWQRHMPNTVFVCPNGHETCLINPSGFQWFDLTKEDKNYVLDFISSIANDYPNIKDFYENEYITLRVEKNSKNFFKRISILSDNLSLSIYLNNCENKKIENRFFYYFPYFEYR